MAEPSKVVHFRNVGQEITESDLLQLVQPFGSVDKLVLLRTKNQALLQMQDLDAAISLVDYFTNSQPSVRGRNVYMQFSSHQELVTDQNQGRKTDMDEEPNRILLVSVHNVLYPMTVDVLNQVFSAYGFVEKIATFQKSAGFQALIQYQTRKSAASAMSALHVCISLGYRNIWCTFCFLRLTELQVNYNNDRSRDFTNPDLPSEQRGRSSQVCLFITFSPLLSFRLDLTHGKLRQ
ncbi:hypothetical protein KSS87_016790 [Heliosperma pusillum]|nr:hypothetical protein KSS87_016790 [Heliosperma pusillum]